MAWRHVDGTNDDELYDMFHRMEQNNLDEVVHKVEAVNRVEVVNNKVEVVNMVDVANKAEVVNRVEVVNIDLAVIEAWVRVNDIHEQGGYLANQTI